MANGFAWCEPPRISVLLRVLRGFVVDFDPEVDLSVSNPENLPIFVEKIP